MRWFLAGLTLRAALGDGQGGTPSLACVVKIFSNFLSSYDTTLFKVMNSQESRL